jgi:predicted permease
MGNLLRRIRYLFHHRRHEADLNAEMQFHRDMLAGEFPDDRARAARAWGNATIAREEARAVWILPWIESFWQDFAYGVRGLWRQPAFSVVALGALGLAIGLNSSLFTVFNAVALRPWPVRDPGRVVNVVRRARKGPAAGHTGGFGVVEWRYLAGHAKAFSGLVLTDTGRVRLDDRTLNLAWVSGNYFSVLVVGMQLGRGFLPEEDRVQKPEAVVVMNYTTWRSHFDGDPAIVGKTILLDDIPVTVVGVTAGDFAGTDLLRTDFWAPFAAWRLLRPQDTNVLRRLTDINYCCSQMAGRLAPGYTRAQGAAEVELLMSQLHGKSELEDGRTVEATGTALIESAGRDQQDKQKVVPVFAAMFLAMTLVLLLACANVGNLLLARAAARRTEIAVRLSIGASRGRLIRQLLVESLALALAAAAIGMLLAWIAPRAIMAQLIPDNSFDIAPDLRVCAYVAGLAVLSCLVFGLAPALHGTRPAGGNARLPLRSVLMSAQVAFSVILLSGAGVLVQGLQRAQHQDPGFRVDKVSVATLELPAALYSGPRARTFSAQLQEALAQARDLPPIAVANDAPMARSRNFTSLRGTDEPENRNRMIQVHEVTGGYFDVLGLPIVAGHNFAHSDEGRDLVLLNETAARTLWGTEKAVGKTIESNRKTWEVIGVVKDAYTTDFNSIGPSMYWQITGRFGVPKLLVADSTAQVRDRITAIVHTLEPKGRVTFTPLAENLRERLEPARYAAILAGALGMLGLVLASIGLSGAFAYMVRQRTREIGIRMALGAQPAQVVRLVLGSNLRALAWGLVAGLAGAFFATRLLTSVMMGVRPFDAVTYAGVLLLLLAAVAVASAAPARRAVRVDPLTALRWE